MIRASSNQTTLGYIMLDWPFLACKAELKQSQIFINCAFSISARPISTDAGQQDITFASFILDFWKHRVSAAPLQANVIVVGNAHPTFRQTTLCVTGLKKIISV